VTDRQPSAGIVSGEIVETVSARHAPMVRASASQRHQPVTAAHGDRGDHCE
jgi:hypothetical protein